MNAPRAALVTGASTGIGRAIAIALGRAGFDLAVTDLDAAWLADLAKEPQLQDRKVVPIALDLRAESSIAQAFVQATQALGALDVLVNNAGRTLQKAAIDVTWDEWNDVIDINLKGGFFLSLAFARHCIEGKRGGAVVSMASTHGLTGIADRSVYGISKGGIIQMTRRREPACSGAFRWVAFPPPRRSLKPCATSRATPPGRSPGRRWCSMAA